MFFERACALDMARVRAHCTCIHSIMGCVEREWMRAVRMQALDGIVNVLYMCCVVHVLRCTRVGKHMLESCTNASIVCGGGQVGGWVGA